MVNVFTLFVVSSEFAVLSLVFAGHAIHVCSWGWSGAMVLRNLPVPGSPTIWITVGQGPTALAIGAGGGCLDIFTLIYSFSLSLEDGPIYM